MAVGVVARDSQHARDLPLGSRDLRSCVLCCVMRQRACAARRLRLSFPFCYSFIYSLVYIVIVVTHFHSETGGRWSLIEALVARAGRSGGSCRRTARPLVLAREARRLLFAHVV